MGLDNWFSSKGLKARARGMEKESKTRKFAILAFFTFSFLISIVLCGIHMERFFNAINVSSEFKDHPVAVITPAYDTCQVPKFVSSVSEDEL